MIVTRFHQHRRHPRRGRNGSGLDGPRHSPRCGRIATTEHKSCGQWPSIIIPHHHGAAGCGGADGQPLRLERNNHWYALLPSMRTPVSVGGHALGPGAGPGRSGHASPGGSGAKAACVTAERIFGEQDRPWLIVSSKGSAKAPCKAFVGTRPWNACRIGCSSCMKWAARKGVPFAARRQWKRSHPSRPHLGSVCTSHRRHRQVASFDNGADCREDNCNRSNSLGGRFQRERSPRQAMARQARALGRRMVIDDIADQKSGTFLAPGGTAVTFVGRAVLHFRHRRQASAFVASLRCAGEPWQGGCDRRPRRLLRPPKVQPKHQVDQFGPLKAAANHSRSMPPWIQASCPMAREGGQLPSGQSPLAHIVRRKASASARSAAAMHSGGASASDGVNPRVSGCR